MPRPCAVESHARHYKNNPPQKSLRCHGLAPWSLTLATTKTATDLLRCHGLAPWSLTLATTKTTPRKNLSDATALRRGVSRSSLQKRSLLSRYQMPRPCAVESHAHHYKTNPRKLSQMPHHGYAKRQLPPVFVEQYELDREDLARVSPKHAAVVAQFHLVMATSGRRGILGSEEGKRIAAAWRGLQRASRYALIKVSFVSHCAHILQFHRPILR